MPATQSSNNNDRPERVFLIDSMSHIFRAFYAPLAKLRTGDARIYLGMIHSMGSLRERLAVVRKFVPSFGLAAYCGFGRTPPEQLPQLLNDHLQALALLNAS